MTQFRYVLRSIGYYWRTHLGVALGAAVATAVLVGALVVGDSVRESLRQMALQRLGEVHLSMFTADRYFTQDLAEKVGREMQTTAAPVLDLNGIAILPGQGRRTGGVHVLGVNESFWELGGLDEPLLTGDANDGIVINRRLADTIDAAAGDRMLLRVARPSALSRDIPLGSEAEESVTINVPIKAVVADEQFGRFSLQANQIPPMNAYVPLELLQQRTELGPRVNTLLLGEAEVQAANAAIAEHWQLEDADVAVRELDQLGVIELRSGRVFVDPPVVDAAVAGAHPPDQRVLTYFVNELRHGDRATPYSMVAAVEPGENQPLPPGTRDDEIAINQWLADDLQADVGDAITLRYYLLGEARQLEQQERTFTVKAIVPTEGPGGDRQLMPDFPGLSDADSSREWNPAIPIDLSEIRDRDEDYWQDYRGTPKAFVTLAFGQQAWGNRFGEVTNLRWSSETHDRDAVAEAVRGAMDPAAIGLMLFDARGQALQASASGFDFGELFIGFSFFIIVSALLLVGLLFGFAVESRSPEIGTLLAVGWTPGQVRRAWLLEGGVLAVVGSLVGLVLGVGYTKAVLWALTTLWTDAVGTTSLHYHAEIGTLVGGTLAGILVAVLTMFWVIRQAGKQPVRALLAARFGTESKFVASANWPLWTGGGMIIAAIAIMFFAGMGGDQSAAGAFFAAGSLTLIGGLLGCWSLLGRTGGMSREQANFTIGRLGWRNSARRRGRSLATIALLACGSFLVVAVNANRQDPAANAHLASSGTGGFALHVETTLPVYHDLNTADGRNAYVLDEDDVADVGFVPLRLRDGDDASCLNLNRAQQPQLMGVNGEHFAERGSFTFAQSEEGVGDGWEMLRADVGENVIPAVADQSTAVWALGLGLGDELHYIDERGEPFRIRIVGMINNSILQGGLILDESRLTERYPSLGGYRVWLVDAPADRLEQVQVTLERALEDVGAQIMPTDQRLAMFSAVENTYLSIFGTLGGLGLILGCVGLGLVVLRNVLERRSELALMRSVGFARSRLRWLVLSEHWGLLALGLGVGVTSALLAVWPAVTGNGADVPWPTIIITLIVVLLSGLLWTVGAAAAVVRGRLIASLRAE
ncbi:MAG: ABC transporter permease [Phycisphaeraceae bacterium]